MGNIFNKKIQEIEKRENLNFFILNKNNFNDIYEENDLLVNKNDKIVKNKMNNIKRLLKIIETNDLDNYINIIYHPNIVLPIEYFQENDKYYLIYEISYFGNLENHLNLQKQLKLEDSKKIIFDISKALNYLYNNNLAVENLDLDKILIFENNFKINITNFKTKFSQNNKLLNSKELGIIFYNLLFSDEDIHYNDKIDYEKINNLKEIEIRNIIKKLLKQNIDFKNIFKMKIKFKINYEYKNNFLNFKFNSKIQIILLNLFLIYFVDFNNINEIINEYNFLDNEGKGFIELSDFNNSISNDEFTRISSITNYNLFNDRIYYLSFLIVNLKSEIINNIDIWNKLINYFGGNKESITNNDLNKLLKNENIVENAFKESNILEINKNNIIEIMNLKIN